MRILSHYFVARFLGLFATVFVAAFLILATVELVLNFDDLSSFASSQQHSLLSTAASAPGSTSATAPIRPNSQGTGLAVLGLLGIARSLGIRLASYYLADMIPIVSFLAAFITFAWAGRAMELVGIQAGGIRLLRVIFPVLVTTLILSFATAILHETVVLKSQRISSDQHLGEHRQPDFGREAFWYHRGRTITNIAFADAETRTLHGVEIFERGSQGAIVKVIRAEIVRIANDGVWHLERAAVWTFDPLDPTAETTLENHAAMTLDLDAIGGDVLLQADPGVLPIAALADYLAAHPGTSPSNLRKLRNRYHDRLASPWLVLVFAWLALPFALRVDERGHFGPAAAAAVAALSVFFLLRSAGETLAQQELIPVGFAPWAVSLMVILGSAIALRRHQL